MSPRPGATALRLGLERASLPQHGLQLAAAQEALQLRIPANVALVDEAVGDGRLARQLLEGILHGGAIRYAIEIDEDVLGAEAVESGPGAAAVAAPGLCEEHCKKSGDAVSNGG